MLCDWCLWITLFHLCRVSNDRLGALIHHYRENGIAPKEKKNGGRQNNKKAFDLTTIQQMSSFLGNYADQHALVLPGRVPGYWRDNVRLLPAAHTKSFVFDVYKAATEKSGMILIIGLIAFTQHAHDLQVTDRWGRAAFFPYGSSCFLPYSHVALWQISVSTANRTSLWFTDRSTSRKRKKGLSILLEISLL